MAFAAPEDADGRISQHPQSHDDFLAKIQTTTRGLISSPRHSYASDSTYAATGPLAPPMSQPFHLPSRSITSPAPVPIDNFAAPRSDSPYANNGLHRRNQSSGPNPLGGARSEPRVVGVEEDGVDSRSMTGESRHRFTIGDTYQYNEYDDEALGRSLRPVQSEKKNKASGWEDEGGRRSRNKKFLACLVILVILIAVAVGVGVGVARKNAKGGSNAQDAGAVTSTNTASSTSGDSSTSNFSTAPTFRTSTALVTSTTQLISSPTPTSTSSRPSGNALSAIAGALQATSDVVPQTLIYAYEVSGETTSARVVYTVPTSVQTRENGQWQFTEMAVLPYPVGVGTGVFTSSLRFRIDPTTTAVVRRRSLPIR